MTLCLGHMCHYAVLYIVFPGSAYLYRILILRDGMENNDLIILAGLWSGSWLQSGVQSCYRDLSTTFSSTYSLSHICMYLCYTCLFVCFALR